MLKFSAIQTINHVFLLFTTISYT